MKRTARNQPCRRQRRNRQPGARLALVMAGAVAAVVGACSRSLEDSVVDLGGTTQEREAARLELLLAKDRSVGPLLAALEDSALVAGRPELVAVLVGLLSRVEDPRIDAALARHLLSDADPRVRARIASEFGLLFRDEHLEVLFRALRDDDGAVRHHALWSLGQMESAMSPVQRQSLRDHARRLATDADRDTRREAMIRVEASIDSWIRDARRLALEARLAQAESLFHQALAYAPSSKRANYWLGRFLRDNGRAAEGERRLQQHGMLLRVPRLEGPLEVDGRLDEPFWRRAAVADSFYQHSVEHAAAVPSDVGTAVYVAWTQHALCIGFRGADAHPDSLVVKTTFRDQSIWYEDIVELFVDPMFDQVGYVHAGVNSLGVISDSDFGPGARGEAWNARAATAAFVGDDFWSVEYVLDFGQPGVPRAQRGQTWGFNVVRVYRGTEYSQWVRTYEGGHRPDEFGLLVFDGPPLSPSSRVSSLVGE